MLGFVAPLFRYFGFLLLVWSWLSFDHYRPWVNFHSEALAFSGLAFLLVSHLLQSSRSVEVPLTGVVLSGIAVVPWVQWVTGISYFAGDALMGSLFLISLAFAVGLGFQGAKSATDLSDGPPLIAHVLWICAIASAAIGLAQWLGVQDRLQMYASQTDPGDRAMGNLGQPNLLATLLLMAMGILGACYEKRWLGRWTFALAIAFLSAVLLLTESRAGLLGMVVMACYVVWKARKGQTRLAWPAPVYWVAGCLLFRLLVAPIHEMLLLGQGRGMELTDSNGRWLIWKQVAAGILEAPWLGYGWNQTPAAHAAGTLTYPGWMTFTYAHNGAIDLMAWVGIPLGLILVGLCVYWLVTRAYRATNPVVICVIAALLPFFSHSIFEFPFAYAFFLVPVGMLIGLVEGNQKASRTIRINAHWIWLLLSAWMVAGACVIYDYLHVEEDFRIVRFENLRIGRTPQDYVPPKIHVLTHMRAMLEAARMRPTPDMDKREMEVLREAAKRFPYGALNFRHAVALGLNGDPQGATKQMALIRGMYGGGYYASVKSDLRQLQAEKYPQLSAVEAP